MENLAFGKSDSLKKHDILWAQFSKLFAFSYLSVKRVKDHIDEELFEFLLGKGQFTQRISSKYDYFLQWMNFLIIRLKRQTFT